MSAKTVSVDLSPVPLRWLDDHAAASGSPTLPHHGTQIDDPIPTSPDAKPPLESAQATTRIGSIRTHRHFGSTLGTSPAMAEATLIHV